MSKAIDITLSASSIDKAIRQLKDYRKWLERKADEVAQRLASLGATKVTLGYARAVYTGTKDISVSVEPVQGGYAIIANGEAVLFVEFGTGATYGYGHPQAGELGMGPGTYPDGKGHWNDPKGWWIPKEAGGGHTYGNPPNPVMYETARDLRKEVLKVAREVFAGG